jgi:hypothetical protein
MKKIILTLSILALLLASTEKAQAGDCSTAGAILVGAVGAAILADAILDDGYHTVSHHYYSQPVYPVAQSYVQYTPCNQVWVPARSYQVWIPAQYGYEYRHGCRVRVLLCQGYYEWQTIPGHYE